MDPHPDLHRRASGLHLREPATGLRILAVLLSVALAGCADGSSGPSEPDDAPVIEITGVEDGRVYTEPVTIHFSASPAGSTTSAALNGKTFRSGDTVDRPGTYTLVVEAFRSGKRSEASVDFSLEVAGDRILILRMFDLGPEGLGGGGDALLLSDSSSLGVRHGMIDAGPRGDAGEPLDEGYVARRLQTLGVDTLEFLQLTHAHADHFVGMTPILDGIHVRRFVYNGQVRSGGQGGSGYLQVLSRADTRADTVIRIESEWEHELGGEGGPRTVHLPPYPSFIDQDTDDGNELNEGSVGTYVEAGGVRLFFAGDGEDQANGRWRQQFASYTDGVDVLKV
ncbi:MAG: MBL fold metallo-hydrolase, partial [bacterium]